MKTQSVLIVACGLAMLLHGCAVPPFPLMLSVADDAAKVRFVSGVEGAFSLYPQNECNNGHVVLNTNSLMKTIDSMQGVSPTRVDMLDPVAVDDASVAEIAIEPFQVVNIGVLAGLACVDGRSFRALPRTQYEVVLNLSSHGRCDIVISELEARPGEGVIRTPLEHVGGLICQR